MMDIPAGNTLPDPLDRRGVAAGLSLARPHHLRSGAGPARLARRHRARPATQVDAFFGVGDADWGYRRMVLHYAQARGERGRRRCVPDRLGAARPDARALGVRRLSGGDAARRARRRRRRRSSAPATHRHLRRRLDRIRRACGRSGGATRCAFRSMRCGRRRRSTWSASTTTRRSPTGATAPTISTARWRSSIYDRDYLHGNLRARRSLRLVLRRRRRARRADAHADHRRARQAVGVPRQGSLELVVEPALRARRRRRAWRRRRPGCRRASRSGSPRSAAPRSTRAPTSRACFPIRNRRKAACRISPTAGATT